MVLREEELKSQIQIKIITQSQKGQGDAQQLELLLDLA